MNKVKLINICRTMIRDNDIGDYYSEYMKSKLNSCSCNDCDIYDIIEEEETYNLFSLTEDFVKFFPSDVNPGTYPEGEELEEDEKQELDTFNKICEACEYFGEKLEVL